MDISLDGDILCVMSFYGALRANRSEADRMCADIGAGFPTFRTEVELQAIMEAMGQC